MTFSTKLFPIALIALAACDVAPRPIDLERSFIETPEEGYQVVADFLTGSLLAERIAAACERFEVDSNAQDANFQWFRDELERLAEDDPNTLNALMRRIGLDLDAMSIRNQGDAAWEAMAKDFKLGRFAVVNAGVSIDAAGRASGTLFRTGLETDCEAADREIAEGTMAGSFLKPVPEDQLGGLTVSVPEAPRIDGPELTASPQFIMPVN